MLNSEDREKISDPERKKILRPKRSARRPSGTSMIAAARRKEDATQLKESASIEKSRPMAGRATFTDDPMKGVVNELMVVARRTMGHFL